MMKRVIGLISLHYRFRSAINGQYVGKLYALLHPDTTVREKIEPRDEGDRL